MSEPEAAAEGRARRMTPSRLKVLTLVVLVALDGLVILAGTQLWFTVVVDGRALPVDGGIAAGALVPLALAGLVLVPALAIAGPVFRAILAVLQVLLGVCVVIQAAIAIGDPILASEAAIVTATGVAGDPGALVDAVESSAWPFVALASGILLGLAGLATLITSRAWPRSGRRYERTRLAAADGAPKSAVDEWDALSDGDDPTR